ncbi:MAG TPA: cell division protein FtsZ, partial [Thermoplasmatales archaeon]|nr:cell division protein FtsZ [Thermoplasmatales archaeon]
MKKIVEEAIARAGNNETVTLSEEDLREMEERNKELEEVLAGLTTNIKVVGCGGAGTNTIER